MSAPKLRKEWQRGQGLASIGNPMNNPAHFRATVVWLLVGAVVLLAALTTIALVNVADDDEHHRDDDDYDGANLVLHDSQRLVLGASLVIPEPGDQDIILVVVQNVDDHNVVNITVTLTLTSEARKRSPIDIALVCPPLYVDNVVPLLLTHTSTTCRGLYALTAGDIVNGNVIHTESMATGTIDGTTMSTVAKPGMSKLGLNDLDMPHGAILGIPGPTGPPGPVNVKVGPCSATPPLTSFVCDASDQLALLFCSLSSNSTQLGMVYICMGTDWIFFGSLDLIPDGNSTGPVGPTGPPGIGIYSANCSGGPPPTTVSEPNYACDSSFALNMVLCNLGSADGNAGIIYACMCSPTCGWVEVGDINAMVPYLVRHCFGYSLSNTPNVWSDLCFLTFPSVGTYYCLAEGPVKQRVTAPSCSLYYGLSRVASTNTWIHNSDRILNLPPISTHPADSDQWWSAPMITSAYVVTSTSPQTIYFTAGIGNQTAGCGHWTSTLDQPVTINCLQITPVG
jgi:hypothetical protein